jgi:dienelactone hydrolase
VIPQGGSGGSSGGQTSGGGQATGGAGGTLPTGTAGAPGGGTSGGGASGGGAPGGGAPTGGTPNGGAGGGATEPGYTPPPRDLMLQPNGPTQIDFSPADAAPGATSFHNGQQQARFNPNAPKIQKKLVIGLGGVGTGPHNGGGLAWASERGYHTIGLDYFNASGGDQGKNYLESFSGEDVGEANVGPINSIMNRVKTALTYLQQQDPGDDWAYYLDAQGNVRWNDVIIFGYSFGGQTAAAATKYVALHRVVATSAPGISEAAAWVMGMPAKTPGTRCFSISGTDDGGHANHMATATRLGWPGEEIATSTSAPPYDNSSLLAVDFGHSEFCSLPKNVLANADELCEWAFGYVKP